MNNTQHRLVTGLFVLLAIVVVTMTALMVSAPSANGENCVPKDAWTEVIEHPEVSHVETVVVTPAVEAVPGQHYSLKGNSGIEKDEVPPTPEVNPDIWQANTEQEPHDNGAGSPVTWYPVHPATSGLHYASHGSQGLRDWFYFRAPVEGQDAVTEEVKVVDSAAWTETVEHPAVVCDTPTPDDDPQAEGPVVTEDETTEDDPVVETETHNQPHKTVKIRRHKSGVVTREVILYDTERKEEGL